MSEWKTTGHYRRTPWRWLRDLFDDTMYARRGIELNKYYRKLNAGKVQLSLPVEEKSIEMIPADTSAGIVPEGVSVTLPEKNSFVESKNTNDYAATLTPSVEVITIPTPYFIPVPIKTIKFKIERTARVIKIKIPKIKINLPMLKRLALAFSIVILILMAFATTIITYRIIALTDGDFIGETYKYKIAEFEEELVIPLSAEIEGIKSTITELKARDDARTFRELTHTPPPRSRTFEVYDKRTGKLLRVIVK